MCGIFGSFNHSGAVLADKLIARISGTLRHRGPDANGFFQDNRVLLGNQRLAILDINDRSNQPIYSDNGDIVVVQNGEIYNYLELRDELKRAGARFTTQGDTEVILRAFEVWGERFVEQLNGMFAIAIYHRSAGTLRLYRDRLGVKPLYFTEDLHQGRVWFASEIKTILAAGYPATPDLGALSQFLALNYVPQPATAFAGIRHLPPAHMAVITRDGLSLMCYWDLPAISPETQMTPAEAQAAILALIDDATRIRMRSDAPFGAFLSGGLDSSTVTGLMSTFRGEAIKTYSIGFDDPRFDETRYAHMASARFGTVHTTKVMEPDATALWPQMIWHCDQPHGDVSFMPMLMVSELARTDVKMVLTGDGGDELFGGYEKYFALLPQGSADITVTGWERAFVRSSGLLSEESAATLLRGELGSAFLDANPFAALETAIQGADKQDGINQVLLAETTTLLPGNNLVKPDRMSMAHSLEVRSPFLDYRMAELAFRIPGSMKLQPNETKKILKSAVAPLLGDELTFRKKQMFTVPIGEWFRQRLAAYCRDILLDGRFAARGLACADSIKRLLDQHIAGKANHTRLLRALISLEIWFRLFIDRDEAMLARASSLSHPAGPTS